MLKQLALRGVVREVERSEEALRDSLCEEQIGDKILSECKLSLDEQLFSFELLRKTECLRVAALARIELGLAGGAHTLCILAQVRLEGEVVSTARAQVSGSVHLGITRLEIMLHSSTCF